MGTTSVETVRQPIVLPAEPVNIADLTRERNALLALTFPAEIVSPQEYAEVAADQGRIQDFIKRAAPPFDELCNGAYRAWKFLCSIRDGFFGDLNQRNQDARSLIGRYNAQQDRLRQEEQRRIREAEQKRLDDERAARAKALEKQGQKDAAAIVRNTPVTAPVTTLPSAVPTVQGLTFREEWKWQPIGGDTPANRKAAAQLVPREYVKLDDVALNALAKNMKGTVKVPGIEFWSEKVPVRRS